MKKARPIAKAILLSLFLTVFVLNTSAQKVTLSFHNESFEKVLSSIKQQTGLLPVFSEQLVDLNRKVNINVKSISVEDALKQLLIGTSLSFEIKNNKLYFVEKKADASKEKPVKLKRINGLVTDEKGEPIIGATVIVKGKEIKTGTVTDVNGKFSIESSSNSQIQISYIGYSTQTFNVDDKTNYNIVLVEDAKGLNEVVVVGYGTLKKSDLTGSVSNLKVDELASGQPATSIEQLIQGRVPGVQITSGTGAPGSGMTFSIRGTTSTSGSNQPLVVIDGYPVGFEDDEVMASIGNPYDNRRPAQNPLANLNPRDIESIEILKDASATAIYGSRAANGVVLVTTKKGKGQDKVEYNFRTDISNLPRLIDVLNTKDYINYSNEAAINSGQNPIYSETDIDLYSGTNTNWQDLIYRTALSQNHQLTLSGGDNKYKYAVSLGYLNQEGIVKNTRFDRGTIRLNLNREINKRISFGVNVDGVIGKNQGTAQASGDAISGSTVRNALTSRPLDAPYTADDELDLSQENGNPLVFVNLSEDINRNTNIRANMFIDLKLTPELLFKARGGANYSSSRRDFYRPMGTIQGNQANGYAYFGEGNAFNYLTEYTLSFNKTYNKKHTINAVAGYTYQEWERSRFGLSASHFPNDRLKYYDLTSASTVSIGGTETDKWALSSFIARANYSFESKYLITFTGRADGSTRLAEGYKWDFFPSLALGWNMHNESFMKSISWLSQLKLRGSYGLTGNQSIGVGATKAKLSSSTSVINETTQIGYVLANMANSILGWETTTQTNLGVDMGFLSNRINITFDYYNKTTNDLLMDMKIPGSTGFGVYTLNIGRIENKGCEFGLNAKILTKNFKWGVGGNISYNRNKVLNLGDVDSFMGPVVGPLGSNSAHIAKVGYPIGSFYGYVIEGIFQNQEEINNSPVDAYNTEPGTYKYKDISGPDGIPDGKITSDDRTIIGNPFPDYIFGVSNDFEWKGFTLSVLVQGSMGQNVINAARYNLDALARNSASNVRQEAYDNRWTGEGTSNTYPKSRMTDAFNGRFTNFIVEDASYIRLKNVTFSYLLPLTKSSFIRDIKLYVSGTNLFTITDYKGYDPEINSLNNAMLAGVDNANIPQFRTISIGINVGF